MTSQGASGRRRDTLTPADSLSTLTQSGTDANEDLRRRLTYLMAFRVLIISLVMGSTTLLYWLDDANLGQASALIQYGIIGATYLLTILYALLLRRGCSYKALAAGQLVGDLLIATLIVHVTGGAQSAYTFFYPLAIIGSAVVRYRKGAIVVSLSAALLFTAVSVLGWYGLLPIPAGQRLLPTDLSSLALSRALGLNLAAIAGIGTLAIQLAAQLQQSSTDLEEHRSAAADLLSLHEDIVRCLTSGLITVDADGIISTINEAAVEILGIDEDSVGKPLEACAENMTELLRSIPIDKLSRRSEIRHGRDGSMILGVSISPLYDHTLSPVGRILNFQDLTEVREMEQHIKRAERLAVIGGLAAGVAHEIRNPLASISGSIELLSGSPTADEDSKALMDIVTREIDRLNTLITELLNYSNPRPMNLVETDINEIIADTLRVFAQDNEFEKIDVDYENAAATAAISKVDPEKIRQLLWNLLRNGAQAASQGGSHLWLRVAIVGSEIVLTVRDDGPGIPKELLHKVFDPFFTTKSKGSGLGLATVHSIVMDHGGTITAEGEDGACFRVRLPYTGTHDG